jgi:hypothetical protein
VRATRIPQPADPPATARPIPIRPSHQGQESRKFHLAKLAKDTGLQITVCHYPPGTSKWNKIEHRLFSFISMNWRGRPLTDIRTIIELIAATTTTTGLTVAAAYDPEWYPTGEKISDRDFAAIPLRPHDWHGEWNYDIPAA